jgi:hypothetical protein
MQWGSNPKYIHSDTTFLQDGQVKSPDLVASRITFLGSFPFGCFEGSLERSVANMYAVSTAFWIVFPSLVGEDHPQSHTMLTKKRLSEWRSWT